MEPMPVEETGHSQMEDDVGLTQEAKNPHIVWEIFRITKVPVKLVWLLVDYP